MDALDMARDPNTQPDVLAVLAEHEDWRVRVAVAGNRAAPKEEMEMTSIQWEGEFRPDWDSTGAVEEAYSATLSDGREVTVYRTGTEWAWFDGHGHSEGPYRTRAQAADACMRESGS